MRQIDVLKVPTPHAYKAPQPDKTYVEPAAFNKRKEVLYLKDNRLLIPKIEAFRRGSSFPAHRLHWFVRVALKNPNVECQMEYVDSGYKYVEKLRYSSEEEAFYGNTVQKLFSQTINRVLVEAIKKSS